MEPTPEVKSSIRKCFEVLDINPLPELRKKIRGRYTLELHKRKSGKAVWQFPVRRGTSGQRFLVFLRLEDAKQSPPRVEEVPTNQSYD
jgi:hypothetical protein